MASTFPSARHQAALAVPTGYRRRAQFTFFRGGESVTLEPVSGRLTQDTRRNGRWNGQLSFLGDEILPTRPGDILTPFGTRVEVSLGIELLDGSVSSVPYGTYEVANAKASSNADSRTVDVTLADISGAVDRYRFETSLTVGSGNDLATMINTVVTNRIGVNPGVSATGVTLGTLRVLGLDTETGPWAEVLDILSGFSRTAWYDRVGHIQIGSTNADPTSAYPISQLASSSIDFDTKPPNVIVVRSDPQDGTAPIQAIAMDTDPGSPTYAGTGPGTSPYGRVTMFYASPLVTTVAQAQSAANTLLANNVGAGATYTLTVPYDPTISAGDVISREGSALAVDAINLDVAGDTELTVRELG